MENEPSTRILSYTETSESNLTDAFGLTTKLFRDIVTVSDRQTNQTSMYPVTINPTPDDYDYSNSDNGNYGNSDYGYSNYGNNTYEYKYEYYEYYNYDYGDEYMYPGFSFERPVYLYIWEFLVVFTSLFNIIVISVFLQRKMRNSTNMILAAIAISDSLTGLATLPTYVMVFQRFEPHAMNFPNGNMGNNFPPGGSEIFPNGNMGNNFPPGGSAFFPNFPNGNMGNNFTPGSSALFPNGNIGNNFPSDGSAVFSNGNMGNPYVYGSNGSFVFNNLSSGSFGTMSQPSLVEPMDGYNLTKDLCRGFMISKLFLSKWFHSISIFLTLFLCVQRFISVAYPFKSQAIFSVKVTVGSCTAIFLLSPILHVFHLNDEKTTFGICQWELKEKGCKGGCIYLWMMFFIRHFIPCIVLISFTALFIRELHKGERTLRRMNSTNLQVSRREDENRRITITVIAIVIVFLIPRIPYGVFLLYNDIDETANDGNDIDQETNRAIHMVYELSLVVSFHANFYIYTMFNRRFRKRLLRTFIIPVTRIFGDKRRLSISRTSPQRPDTRKTYITRSRSGSELKDLHTINRSKSSSIPDAKVLESLLMHHNTDTYGNGVQKEYNETKFLESDADDRSSVHDALNVDM